MNLPWVIRRMPSRVDEVAVVGERSHDHTVDVSRGLGVDVVVVNEQRKLKAVAGRAGFVAAPGDIIVKLDADRSTDPQPRGKSVLPRAVLAGIRDWSTGSNPRGPGRAGSIVHPKGKSSE
jgi:hypothetical protein